jgi:hypothetical protein
MQAMDTIYRAYNNTNNTHHCACIENYRMLWGVHCCVTQPHPRARPLSQDLLLLGPKKSKVLLFPYREIFTPQILFSAIPLSLLIGGSKLAASQVHCRSLGSRIPKTRWPVNAEFIFPYRDFCFVKIFPYRDIATRDVKHYDLLTPDTRCNETPMHA